jgi:predicted nucleotidyltransferase
MLDIQNIGKITPVDPEGFIPNIAGLENISGQWKEAVDAVIEVYKNNLGEDLHSVYIRGSIVRGTAVAGVSDLDTIAIVKSETDTKNLSWQKDAAAELARHFKFIIKFELQIIPLEQLISATEYFMDRFVIKVQSICVYGEDVAQKIDNFYLDKQLAQALYTGFPKTLEKVLLELKNSVAENITMRCTWIMKRILRAGCALVIDREQVFTRDLYPSYELFAKYYPDKRKEMYQALEWALNPINDKEKLLNFLEEFGTWLVSEIGRQLKS